MRIIKTTRNTYKELLDVIDIGDWNTPFHDDEDDFELSYSNPYSKITCLVAQLYSMELGSPPLYAEVNRVARDMDLSNLKELGPYLKTLSEITRFAESYREEGDKITPGEEIGSAKANLSGCFLLFRGAQMKPEWIKPYKDNVGKAPVFLPGNTSTSRNPLVALGFALDKPTKVDFVPVIYVFLCKNYDFVAGFQLNNEALTAYPEEAEFLLEQGCNVTVLAVEENVILKNKHVGLENYDGKTV